MITEALPPLEGAGSEAMPATDLHEKQKQQIKSIVAALATLEKEQVTDLVPKPFLEKARALAATASSS